MFRRYFKKFKLPLHQPIHLPANPTFLKLTNYNYSPLAPFMRGSDPCPLLVEQNESEDNRRSLDSDVRITRGSHRNVWGRSAELPILRARNLRKIINNSMHQSPTRNSRQNTLLERNCWSLPCFCISTRIRSTLPPLPLDLFSLPRFPPWKYADWISSSKHARWNAIF